MSTDLYPLATWPEGILQARLPANDNSLRLEAMGRGAISDSTTAQPVSPVDGDIYIIPAGATGAQWSTFTAGDIAMFRGGTWLAFTPVGKPIVNVDGALKAWNGSAWLPVGSGSGDVVGPSSATDSAIALFDSTTGKLIKDSGETIASMRRVAQNSQSAAYTLVLSDAGKHIYHPPADTTARTWTIPANSSVAFPVGTVITFDNDYGAGAITIAITSDTLVLVGAAGSTGSRTLASGGQATAIKVGSTRWRISGVGLT